MPRSIHFKAAGLKYEYNYKCNKSFKCVSVIYLENSFERIRLELQIILFSDKLKSTRWKSRWEVGFAKKPTIRDCWSDLYDINYSIALHKIGMLLFEIGCSSKISFWKTCFSNPNIRLSKMSWGEWTKRLWSGIQDCPRKKQPRYQPCWIECIIKRCE